MWAGVQEHSGALKYIYLLVRAVTMIATFVEVMKDIRAKITMLGLWLIFVSVALLIWDLLKTPPPF
jgi:hypothetical protein